MGNVLGRRKQREWTPGKDGQSPDKTADANGSHRSKASVEATSAAKITSGDETPVITTTQEPEVNANGGATSTLSSSKSHPESTSNTTSNIASPAAVEDDQTKKDLEVNSETSAPVVETSTTPAFQTQPEATKTESQPTMEQQPIMEQQPQSPALPEPTVTSLLEQQTEIPPELPKTEPPSIPTEQEESSINIRSQQEALPLKQEVKVEESTDTKSEPEIVVETEKIFESPAPPTSTPAEPVEREDLPNPYEAQAPFPSENNNVSSGPTTEETKKTEEPQPQTTSPAQSDIQPTQEQKELPNDKPQNEETPATVIATQATPSITRDDSVFNPDRIIEEVTAEAIKIAAKEIQDSTESPQDVQLVVDTPDATDGAITEECKPSEEPQPTEEPTATPLVEETKALEEPKPQETKIEETNVEETNVEETNVEETNVEETKVEETKVEETKVEEAKAETEPAKQETPEAVTQESKMTTQEKESANSQVNNEAPESTTIVDIVSAVDTMSEAVPTADASTTITETSN